MILISRFRLALKIERFKGHWVRAFLCAVSVGGLHWDWGAASSMGANQIRAGTGDLTLPQFGVSSPPKKIAGPGIFQSSKRDGVNK